MDKTIKKPVGRWAILADATGYSRDYCRKVVEGERSRKSKGGKIIMQKYVELQKLVNNGNGSNS